MELTQLPDLLCVRAVSVPAGHLEHDREVLQLRVGEEDTEPFAHDSVADVVMTVAVRSERRLGVVRVQRSQSVQADAIVHVTQSGIGTVLVEVKVDDGGGSSDLPFPVTPLS